MLATHANAGMTGKFANWRDGTIYKHLVPSCCAAAVPSY